MTKDYFVVSCVFPPEPVVSARTSADVAGALTQEGDTVTVITSIPSRPGGVYYPNHKIRLFSADYSPEYGKIIRCFSISSKKSSLTSRFLENISFGLSTAWYVLINPRPAAIYANTWPIFAAGLLAIAAKVRRIPIVLSIQDVYPESLAAQGRIPNKNPFLNMIKKVDSLIARSAKQVIVISDIFAALYRKERNLPVARLTVVPNWLDSRSISFKVDVPAFRRRQNISEESFLMVYGGNIGVAAGVQTVIEAMAECEHEHKLRFLIAGDGSMLKECKRLTARRHENRIIFLSPWPAEDTSVVLRSADLLVLPTQGNQSKTSVPSKLVAYMLSGKPVLAQAVYGSETARIVQDSGCGWVVKPNSPKLLANQILSVCALKQNELQRRGFAGREYALSHFSKEACMPKVIEIIRKASNNRTLYTENERI